MVCFRHVCVGEATQVSPRARAPEEGGLGSSAENAKENAPTEAERTHGTRAVVSSDLSMCSVGLDSGCPHVA